MTINTEETASSEDIGNLEARQNSEQTEEDPLSAHEINPDVYEWLCGKESFQAMEEPEDVIYFAKNKDLFDAIAEEFSQYKGKDVDYIVSMSDGELWETDDGNVAIREYDTKYVKKLLQDGYIKYIYLYDIGITFAIEDNDLNNIIYSFDNEIDPFSKANIASHWWWQMGVGE